MTTKRFAALTALLGAVVATTGVVLLFGVSAGLICGGLFLVAAASTNL